MQFNIKLIKPAILYLIPTRVKSDWKKKLSHKASLEIILILKSIYFTNKCWSLFKSHMNLFILPFLRLSVINFLLHNVYQDITGSLRDRNRLLIVTNEKSIWTFRGIFSCFVMGHFRNVMNFLMIFFFKWHAPSLYTLRCFQFNDLPTRTRLVLCIVYFFSLNISLLQQI